MALFKNSRNARIKKQRGPVLISGYYRVLSPLQVPLYLISPKGWIQVVLYFQVRKIGFPT